MPDGDAHDVELPEPEDAGDLGDAGPDERDADVPDDRDGARDDSAAPDWRDEDRSSLERLADPPAGAAAASTATGDEESLDEPLATWADEASWDGAGADESGWPGPSGGPETADEPPGTGGEGGWESLAAPGAEYREAGTAAAFEALVAGADDEAIEAAYAGDAREALETLRAEAAPPDATPPHGAAEPGAPGLPIAFAFGAVGGAWAAPPPTSGVGYGTAPAFPVHAAREAAPVAGRPAGAGLAVAAVGPGAFAATCGADHDGAPWWGPRRARVEDAQEDARAHAGAWPGHSA